MGSRLIILFSLLITIVSSYKFFHSRIPNGELVPHPCKPNYIWYGVGHMNELGGGARNPFGEDFNAAGKRWTVTLCQKDSDDDGKTNGEELGDPNCVWTEGGFPEKSIGLSHPGVCEPYDSPQCKPQNTHLNCELESLKCDAIKSPDVKNVTLKYPQTAVPNTETNYYCMTFELPSDGDYHLIGTKPAIDNYNVMHHMLLYGCDNSVTQAETYPNSCGMGSQQCGTIIAAWAVGYNGECAHPDVGFRIGQNGFKYAMLQFHWNNPELRSDYTDGSGITLYYTPKLRPNDAAVVMVGQQYLEIPPGKERVQVDANCDKEDTNMVLSGPVQVTRAFNHMHYLGREQYISHFRNNVKITTLTSEADYSYDRPVFNDFQKSIEIKPGDEIKTTCVFKSTSKSTTTFEGDATSDEMCFGFLTLHPISNLRSTYCINWKSLSTMKLYSQETSYGCNSKAFFNYSHPDTKPMYDKIRTRCLSLSKCLEECKEAVKEIKRHPCLTGDMGDGTLWQARLSGDFETLNFFSKIQSCDVEILRESLSSRVGIDDTSNKSDKLFHLKSVMAVFLISKILQMIA